MKGKLRILLRRYVKFCFIKLRLHGLTSFLNGVFVHLIYLNRFSKWCNEHRNIPFTSFGRPRHDPKKRLELFEFVYDSENLSGPIDYLEFGVASGASLRWWVGKNHDPSSRFFGFDSFEGLPQDFGFLKKGTFSQEAMPEIGDRRCELKPGLFQQTLPVFLQSETLDRRNVIHLDADLYSSTLFVLTAFGLILKKDDILIFDEFGVPTHEFRALLDFTESWGLPYTVLAETNNFFQVAVKLL